MGMVIDEYGQVVSDGVVRFERVMPGSVETVFEHIVDGKKRGTWLARGEMERRKGGRIELFFKHSELSTVPEPTPEKYKAMENGHGFTGEVTVYEPPRRVGFTWGEGSEVLFELTPEGENTRLVLTHFKLQTRGDMVGVSGGWHTHLGVLADRLAGSDPGGFWARHGKMEGVYEGRFGEEVRGPKS